MIAEATCLEDLGVVYRILPDGSFDGKLSVMNTATMRQLLTKDEGLFCHMVNKVTKLMRSGAIPRGDVLGILGTELVDVSELNSQRWFATRRYKMEHAIWKHGMAEKMNVYA
jgi:hypothetical protein